MAKRIKTQAELEAEKRKAAKKPAPIKKPLPTKKATTPLVSTQKIIPMRQLGENESGQEKLATAKPGELLPATNVARAILRGKRTPDEIAGQKKAIVEGRAATRAARAAKNVQITVRDRNDFIAGKKAGSHGFTNVRDFVRDRNAKDPTKQPGFAADREADDKARAEFVRQESDPRLAAQREIRDRQAKRIEAVKDIRIKTAGDEKAARENMLSIGTFGFHGVKPEDIPSLSESERKAHGAIEKLFAQVANRGLSAKQALPQIQAFAKQLNAGSVRRERVEQELLETRAKQVQKEADLETANARTARLLEEKEAKVAVVEKRKEKAEALDSLSKQYTEQLKTADGADVARVNGILAWIAAEKAKALGVEIPPEILNPNAAATVEKTTAVTEEGAVGATKVEADGVTIESVEALPKGHVLTEQEFLAILASEGGDKKKAFATAKKMGFK